MESETVFLFLDLGDIHWSPHRSPHNTPTHTSRSPTPTLTHTHTLTRITHSPHSHHTHQRRHSVLNTSDIISDQLHFINDSIIMFGGWGGKGKKGDNNEISEAPAKGWNFDPTGFERAAKALKEINSAPNSDAALEIIKNQDETKRLEHAASIEQAKARQLTAESERIRTQQEEQRKTMEQEHYQQQKMAQYQDQLTRKRAEDERAAQQYMREQERQKNEASQLRLEAEKRATLAQELDTRAKAAKDRALAEAEGRIIQERRNHDLKMKELKAEGEQKMETVLESIKLIGVTIGEGISNYFSDTDKMMKTVGTLTAIAVGVYTAKVSTGIVGRFVESRLGKPVLVRETSKRTILDMARDPLVTIKEVFSSKDTNALKGVVLEDGLASRLQSVAVSISSYVIKISLCFF